MKVDRERWRVDLVYIIKKEKKQVGSDGVIVIRGTLNEAWKCRRVAYSSPTTKQRPVFTAFPFVPKSKGNGSPPSKVKKKERKKEVLVTRILEMAIVKSQAVFACIWWVMTPTLTQNIFTIPCDWISGDLVYIYILDNKIFTLKFSN